MFSPSNCSVDHHRGGSERERVHKRNGSQGAQRDLDSNQETGVFVQQRQEIGNLLVVRRIFGRRRKYPISFSLAT